MSAKRAPVPKVCPGASASKPKNGAVGMSPARRFAANTRATGRARTQGHAGSVRALRVRTCAVNAAKAGRIGEPDLGFRPGRYPVAQLGDGGGGRRAWRVHDRRTRQEPSRHPLPRHPLAQARFRRRLARDAGSAPNDRRGQDRPDREVRPCFLARRCRQGLQGLFRQARQCGKGGDPAAAAGRRHLFGPVSGAPSPSATLHPPGEVSVNTVGVLLGSGSPV